MNKLILTDEQREFYMEALAKDELATAILKFTTAVEALRGTLFKFGDVRTDTLDILSCLAKATTIMGSRLDSDSQCMMQELGLP